MQVSKIHTNSLKIVFHFFQQALLFVPSSYSLSSGPQSVGHF